MTNLSKVSIALFSTLLLSPALQSGDYSSGKQSYGKEVIPACDLFYIEIFGGGSFYPDLDYAGIDYPMETGYNIGGAIGTALNDRIDVEFEGFFTETGYTGFNDSFTRISLMANAYYNIPLGQTLVGYVGGGVGAMNIGYEPPGGNRESDWVFGYQLIAGVRYPITPCIDLFGEYRHSLAPDDAVLYGTDNAEYRSNDVSVGVRFKF